MEHKIRTNKPFFEAMLGGMKLFELRKNDRGYQAGDTVLSYEVENTADGKVSFTGRCMKFQITYVLANWGLQDGYVAFGVGKITLVDGGGKHD